MSDPVVPSPASSADVPRRGGTVFKMAVVCLLVLLLLIPLALIRGVLSERLQRRDEAVANITSTWAPNR